MITPGPHREEDFLNLMDWLKAYLDELILFSDIKYYKISGEEYPQIFTRKETFNGKVDTATKVRLLV